MSSSSKESAATKPSAKQGAHQKNLARPSAEEIYKQVATNARQELKRSSLSLAISGFGGGIFMGLSALGTAIVLSLMPALRHGCICSRACSIRWASSSSSSAAPQLFTENTLYPVALVLAEKRALLEHPASLVRRAARERPRRACLRVLASLTPASPRQISRPSRNSAWRPSHIPPATVFWSGVMGGWIIALAAWLVSGSHSITGSVMIIWLLTFVVGLGNFAHCIATSGEIFAAILTHQAPWSAYPHGSFPPCWATSAAASSWSPSSNTARSSPGNDEPNSLSRAHMNKPRSRGRAIRITPTAAQPTTPLA